MKVHVHRKYDYTSVLHEINHKKIYEKLPTKVSNGLQTPSAHRSISFYELWIIHVRLFSFQLIYTTLNIFQNNNKEKHTKYNTYIPYSVVLVSINRYVPPSLETIHDSF